LPPGRYPPPAGLRAQVLIFEALPQLAPGRRGVGVQARPKQGVERLGRGGHGLRARQLQAGPQVVGGRRGMAVESLSK
jgi:hypothetical protein